jgi:hypothetical protein
MKELQVVSPEEKAELGGSAGTTKKQRKQSERLDEAFAEADVELFHDPEFRTYATFGRDGHRETWPLRSQGFRRFITHNYFRAEGEPPRAQVLADFIGVLEGRAQFEGEMEEVFVRIAPTPAGGIAIDLGDAAWSAVEVTATGWRAVATPPVKFVRPRGLWPLPEPVDGGSIELLRPFLNVTDEDQWKLLIGFLVGMFRPAGPYPVLALGGEQGTAKSTAMRVLRRLVDPRQTLDRAAPRDDHDLAIHAMHNWVVALDNVSGLADWLSDGLARLATGSGFSTRQLYTDSEEFSFSAARPVMINGIGDVIDRSDLLDRALLVNLTPITEQNRRLEEAFWADFEDARPRILGALLDAVAGALARVESVRLASWPRMADFARFVTAAEPALGWRDGSFLAAYYANRGSAHELALEADPIAVALRGLVSEKVPTWEGRPTDLLEKLGQIAGENTTKQRNWPKAANVLTTRLQRLAPNLRSVGIEVVRDRSEAARTIKVSIVGSGASAASATSSSGPTPHHSRRAPDGNDAGLSTHDVQRPPLKLEVDWTVFGDTDTAPTKANTRPPCPGCGHPLVPTLRVDRPYVCTNPGHQPGLGLEARA